MPPAKVRMLFSEWASPNLLAGERRRESDQLDEEGRESREFAARLREIDRMTRALTTSTRDTSS